MIMLTTLVICSNSSPILFCEHKKYDNIYWCSVVEGTSMRIMFYTCKVNPDSQFFVGTREKMKLVATISQQAQIAYSYNITST